MRYISLVGFEDHATIIEEAYSESGYDVALRQVVALPIVESYSKATIYGLLGESELTYECLEKAYEERSPWIVWLINPAFDGLHSDPRFQALQKKIGLAE